MMKDLTANDFKEWGVRTDVSLYIVYFNKYIKLFDITSKDRFCSFMANVFHESANLYYVREVLPKNNPAYVKKLGNYFGRGFFQCSWSRNYKAFTDWCKVFLIDFKDDFVKKPELVESPHYAVLSAFWYWKVHNLEQYADTSQFINVCSIINTGKIQNKNKPHTINGLDDRINRFVILSKWCDKNKIT